VGCAVEPGWVRYFQYSEGSRGMRRYVPWNQVGCVVHALSEDAALTAQQEELQAARGR
jgi:hypothetical protein